MKPPGLISTEFAAKREKSFRESKIIPSRIGIPALHLSVSSLSVDIQKENNVIVNYKLFQMHARDCFRARASPRQEGWGQDVCRAALKGSRFAAINADAITVPDTRWKHHLAQLPTRPFSTYPASLWAEIPRESFAFRRCWCIRDVVIHELSVSASACRCPQINQQPLLKAFCSSSAGKSKEQGARMGLRTPAQG